MDHQWDFRVGGYRGRQLLVETVHRGLSSMQMEVDVWHSRMARGECDEIRVTDQRPAWIAEYQGGGNQTRVFRHAPFRRNAKR